MQSAPSQTAPSSRPVPSSSLRTIQPSHIRTAGPSHLPISRRISSTQLQDTGTHIFYKGLAKEARAAKKREASVPKSRRSSSSTTDAKQTVEKRFVKAGVTLYVNDKLQKNTGIVPQVLEVDTKKPDFYEDLRHQLWTLFSDEIMKKAKIDYPPNPEQYTSLGTVDSKIENHNTLLELARSGKTIKSKAVINLFYEHPIETYPETNLSTQAARTTRKRKSEADQPKARKSATWALGGTIATKPIRGSTSLDDEVEALCHPVSKSITMKPNGWITARRLHLFNFDESPPPGSSHQPFKISKYIRAVTFPFDIQVDKSKNMGQGSSRQSLLAHVRSFENEREVINKWVAKFRYLDSQPNLYNHATDAITYRGFGLILAEFKDLINKQLEGQLWLKGSQIELVRHCMVVVGEMNRPDEVYFFESYLSGDFVKYSSNLNFNISAKQKGMDEDFLSLMNALTHWSYNQSQGQRLVCDLQGFGPILTDPQVADLNAE
ncbi:hypothetical protein PTTG_29830 [Puccinia triticina 1-1 BBBD Race 1]|uniref:Alpha-type protein kinase domain-containing protein n=1 Tax=Puccinia triticina (isolate 1-1 / race 1 (BBBD)) TaxID=630390 RepID=A0A180G1N2_PUCT1|nr:hypothetical protein PTTG_29830 [Puccinia triticina 1-1 BBBD Race 1]